MSRLSFRTSISAAACTCLMSHVAFATSNGSSDETVSAGQSGAIVNTTDLGSTRGTRADSAGSTQSRWYGDSILYADLAALGLGALSLGLAADDSSSPNLVFPVALAGVTTYLVGGPIIHATHGNYGKMAGSIGLRLGVPLGGALVGAGIGAATEAGCTGEWCGISAAVGGILGFGSGMILASVIDIAGVAYDSPERTQVALVPTVDAQRGGAGLNLVGIW